MKSSAGGKGKLLQGNPACFPREAPAVQGWGLEEPGGRSKTGKDLSVIQQRTRSLQAEGQAPHDTKHHCPSP